MLDLRQGEGLNTPQQGRAAWLCPVFFSLMCFGAELGSAPFFSHLFFQLVSCTEAQAQGGTIPSLEINLYGLGAIDNRQVLR